MYFRLGSAIGTDGRSQETVPRTLAWMSSLTLRTLRRETQRWTISPRSTRLCRPLTSYQGTLQSRSMTRSCRFRWESCTATQTCSGRMASSLLQSEKSGKKRRQFGPCRSWTWWPTGYPTFPQEDPGGREGLERARMYVEPRNPDSCTSSLVILRLH